MPNPCIEKHFPELSKRYEELLSEGILSEREAAIKAALEEHKKVFDQLQKFRKEIGLGAEKYVPFDNSKEVKEIKDRYNALIEGKNKGSEGELPLPIIEATKKDLLSAQSRYDKANKKLKEAEKKISETQSAQQGMFGGEKQKGMFAMGREEALKALQPLRDEVKNSKSSLDEINRKLEVQNNNKNTDIFKEEKLFSKNELSRIDAKEVYRQVREVADEPVDADQIALKYIADGGRVSEQVINEISGTAQRAKLNTGAKEFKSNEVKARDYSIKSEETLDDIAHSLWEKSNQEISERDIKDSLMDVINTHNTRLEAGQEYLERYSPEYAEKNQYEKFLKEHNEEIEKEEKDIQEWLESEGGIEFELMADENYVTKLIEQYEQQFKREDKQITSKTESGINKENSSNKSNETEKVNLPDVEQNKKDEVLNTEKKGDTTNEPPNQDSKETEGNEGEKEGVLLSHKGLQEIADEFNLPDINPRERISDLEEFAAVDKTLDAWDKEGTYKKNIEKIITDAETGEALNFQQRVLLQQHIANEKAKVAAIRDSKGVTSKEYDVALRDLNKLVRAGETARSTAGAALRTGEIRSVENPTMEDWMNEKKESLEVEDLTKEQKEDIEKKFKEYEAAVKNESEKNAAYEAEISSLKAELALKETDLEQRKTIRKKGREALTKEREDIFESIKEKLRKARGESKAIVVPYLNDLIAIAPDVAKLVRNLAETGTSKLEDVVDIIYTNLKDAIPNIQKKDVNDLIAGKYDKEKPTRSALALQLSDLRAEAKLIAELERLEEGGEPKEPKKAVAHNKRLKELREQIREYSKDNTTLNSIKKRNENQRKQIEQDIKDGNFETKKKVPFDENKALKTANPKLWQETMDAVIERREMKQKWELSKLEDERSKMNFMEKGAYYVEGTIATSRAIVSGVDDSFVFVQAGIAMAANPVSGIKAFNEHFRDAVSPTRFNRQLAALHLSPRWDLIDKSGLDVLEPASLTAKKVEEMFDKNLLNKTFTFKGKDYNLWKYSGGVFERAFISMGNNLRVNIFLKRADQLEAQGKTFETHPQDFKDAARVVNEMTGRGKLNTYVEQASPLITPIVWSPRMIASSLNVLGVSDIAYGVMGKKGYYASLTPSQRKFAISQTVKGISMGIGIMSAAAYGGADEVDFDPRSVTFGNIRFGTKSYNVFGRFSGYVKLIVQQVVGQRKLPNGATQELSGEKEMSILGKFARGKMTPFAGFVYDLRQGENTFTRKPVTVADAPKALLMPMSSQEIGNGLKQDGSISLLTRFVPSFLGLKVSDSRDFTDAAIKKTPETEWIGSLGANIQPISKKQLKVDDSKGEPIEATDAQYKEYLKEFNTKLVQALAKAKKDGYYFLNDNGTTTLRQPSTQLKGGRKETEAQEMANQIKEDVNKEVKNKLFPNKKNYRKEQNKSILNDYRSTWGDKLFPSTQKIEEIQE